MSQAVKYWIKIITQLIFYEHNKSSITVQTTLFNNKKYNELPCMCASYASERQKWFSKAANLASIWSWIYKHFPSRLQTSHRNRLPMIATITGSVFFITSSPYCSTGRRKWSDIEATLLLWQVKHSLAQKQLSLCAVFPLRLAVFKTTHCMLMLILMSFYPVTHI